MTGWGEWLRERLHEHDWIAADLVRRTDGAVGSSQMTRWLRYGQKPKFDTVKLVCGALGVPAVDGLLAAGLLDPADVGATVIVRPGPQLDELPHRHLLDSLGRRLQEKTTGEPEMTPTDPTTAPAGVMAPPTHAELIRAIGDPGSFLPRGDIQPDGASDYTEPITSWSARAVAKLLADAVPLAPVTATHEVPEPIGTTIPTCSSFVDAEHCGDGKHEPSQWTMNDRPDCRKCARCGWWYVAGLLPDVPLAPLTAPAPGGKGDAAPAEIPAAKLTEAELKPHSGWPTLEQSEATARQVAAGIAHGCGRKKTAVLMAEYDARGQENERLRGRLDESDRLVLRMEAERDELRAGREVEQEMLRSAAAEIENLRKLLRSAYASNVGGDAELLPAGRGPTDDLEEAMSEQPYERTQGPIHNWFELTYSTHQVLPRVLMQSMPLDWQRRMVTCLEEIRAAFAHVEQPDYEVKPCEWIYVSEATDDQLAQAGVTRDDSAWDDETIPLDEQRTLYHDAQGREMHDVERIAVPREDTLPCYRRGYVEPDESAITTEPLHEVQCPQCGATIRARMADAPEGQR